MKPTPENGLPEPNADSARHSLRVAKHLRQRIGSDSISFAEFMQEALYAPGLGYYVAGNRKFGVDGDYVTAPEISDLFGFVVATQLAPVLQSIESGIVIEPGAGSGALAVSILRRLAELDTLPERYQILEISPELRQRQNERFTVELPELNERIEWIAEIPTSFSGVVVANEVADAIPVERFRIDGDDVMQARVSVQDNKFTWSYEPAPAFLSDAVREIEADLGSQLPHGYVSEVSIGLRTWVEEVCAAIDRGLLLISDYGVSRREYYAPERNDGWLRCHFRHRAHNDPFIWPGIQDLTAWVDFSQVASVAAKGGMTVAGFDSQANFLMHGGLAMAMVEFAELPIERQVELSAHIKLMTLPGEMGENFKFLGLCREVSVPPVFEVTDRAHLL